MRFHIPNWYQNNLILILLIISIQSHGQDLDSLTRRILTLEANQNQIQVNLTKAHSKFSTGTMLIVGGVVTTIAAVLLYNRGLRNENSDNNGRVMPSPVILGIGSGMMMVGTVIQIDSHKWIGRAGRRRK